MNEEDHLAMGRRFWRLQFSCAEVEDQCEVALTALDLLRQDEAPFIEKRLALHALLIAIADLSKLLFENPNGWRCTKEERARWVHGRQVLRAILSVRSDSPLRMREMRNFFEHYDEHLDRLMDRAQAGMAVLDLAIGPPEDMADGAYRLRYFDTSTETLYFGEEPYDLAPVIEEIRSLRGRAHSVTHSSG